MTPWHSGAAARHLLFAAAGALAIALQVTLLRELIVALGGDESAVGVGLAAWLAGIALGAWAARRLARRVPARAAALTFSLLALAGPVQVVAGRYLRLALAPPPGELLPLGSSILLAVATLAPAGALVGATFTALAAAAAAAGVPPGRGIARLYIFESIGSLAGGLAITFLVVPFLPSLQGITLIAAACAALGTPAAYAAGGGEAPPRRAGTAPPAPSSVPGSLLPGRILFPALAATLVVLALPSVSRLLDDASSRARFEGLAPGFPLLDRADTPYQHVAVGGDGGRHLYPSGQYAGTISDAVSAEGLAHTIACLVPRPARVLALGGFVLGPLRFLLRHPVERIDIPEPDARALAVIRRHLAPEDAAALDDPRVRISRDDPRRFLARPGEPYDLIAVMEPDPITLLLARLTTVEFYRLAAERLAPEGVLVVSLRTAPNVLTGETAALGGAVYGALREVFPVVGAGPGPDGILVAGLNAAAATLDPGTLAARWRERGISAEAFAPEMFPVIFPPERVSAQEEALARAAADVPSSRDDRPVSFLHALARRQTITGGVAGRALSALAAIPRPVLALLPLLPSVLLLAARALGRRPGVSLRGGAIHATVVTGTCGMVWSLLLLFSFQTRAGALYGQLGLLTALFMLGLAAGGTAAARGATASAERARIWLLTTTGLALAYAAILALALPALGRIAPGAAGPAAFLHGALLFLAGMATGGVFPAAAGALLASRRGDGPAVRSFPDVGAAAATSSTAARSSSDADTGTPPSSASAASAAADAAGAVESADHAGAAAAALFAAVLFIPLFGLVATAFLLAAMQAAAVAVIATTPPAVASAP